MDDGGLIYGAGIYHPVAESSGVRAQWFCGAQWPKRCANRSPVNIRMTGARMGEKCRRLGSGEGVRRDCRCLPAIGCYLIDNKLEDNYLPDKFDDLLTGSNNVFFGFMFYHVCHLAGTLNISGV